MNFKKNFLFGAASASYQVEGAWNQNGKGVSNWDVFSKIPGKTFEGTNGDIAVDHYNRYLEDIALMKEMKLDSYRFSISWSRIFPQNENTPNLEGLNFYHNLIDNLIASGVKPFITLYHWDLPNYLEEEGGWTNSRTVDAFEKYAKTCFENFASKVSSFITFNEAIVFTSLGYLEAAHPPGLSDPAKYFVACHNVNLAHAKAVLCFKNANYNGEIGITHVLNPVYAGDCSQNSFKAKKWVEERNLDWFYDPILKGSYPKGPLNEAFSFGLNVTNEDLVLLKTAAKLNDFIGVNYYQPTRVVLNEQVESKPLNRNNSTGQAGTISFDGVTRSIVRDDCNYTKWMWEIYPQALYDGLKLLHEKYDGIKIYITENGLGDVDLIEDGEILDQPRIDYINDHLFYVNEAIKNGINVCGYFAWSFTDLLSWLNGFKKQYGFVFVDHNNNLERLKKASFKWYQEVLETRGENIKQPK
jgi:6-phospho-beta-glucosidase